MRNNQTGGDPNERHMTDASLEVLRQLDDAAKIAAAEVVVQDNPGEVAPPADFVGSGGTFLNIFDAACLAIGRHFVHSSGRSALEVAGIANGGSPLEDLLHENGVSPPTVATDGNGVSENGDAGTSAIKGANENVHVAGGGKRQPKLSGRAEYPLPADGLRPIGKLGVGEPGAVETSTTATDSAANLSPSDSESFLQQNTDLPDLDDVPPDTSMYVDGWYAENEPEQPVRRPTRPATSSSEPRRAPVFRPEKVKRPLMSKQMFWTLTGATAITLAFMAVEADTVINWAGSEVNKLFPSDHNGSNGQDPSNSSGSGKSLFQSHLATGTFKLHTYFGNIEWYSNELTWTVDNTKRPHGEVGFEHRGEAGFHNIRPNHWAKFGNYLIKVEVRKVDGIVTGETFVIKHAPKNKA